MKHVACVATLVLGLMSTASAGNADSPKAVAAAIKRALGTEKGLGQALGRAKALRKDHTDKQLAPVLKALGGAFKKSKVTPRWVVLETLEELKIKGSYPLFKKLLDVPKKLTSTSIRNLHYRAIRMAGALREDGSMGDLEKVLKHEDRGIARGAARALASFAEIEDKEAKRELALRLVKRLGKLEKMAKKKDEKAVAYATNVIGELNKTIEALTGESGPSTAAEWKEKLGA